MMSNSLYVEGDERVDNPGQKEPFIRISPLAHALEECPKRWSERGGHVGGDFMESLGPSDARNNVVEGSEKLRGHRHELFFCRANRFEHVCREGVNHVC